MGNCVTAQVRHVSGASQGSRTLAGSGRGQKGNVGDNGEREDLVPAVALTQQFVPHAFTYADLKQATRNFRPDTLLGEGGFGSVFKGNIDERTFQPARVGQGMLVAVKKLNKDSLQGDKEWLAELKYLGALRHPNVVKLFGYCCEGDHRLLVYEFFPRGSLENHLFGRSGHTLPWNTRLKIAVDAAKGLTFLHNAKIPVIYRDFKSSNILLDSEFNAKLSDFGLAKDGPTGDKTHVTTQVLGTYGYAAPEYVATGKLTPKSDVYGFGVVLLEILTGKRAVDKARNGGEINLVEWATPYLIDKRKWSRVLDQRLDGQYSFKGAHIAANVSLQCLCSDPKLRPTMQDVLESLQPLVDPKASASARSSSKSKGKSPYNTPNRDRKDINVSKQGHEVDADAKPTIAFKLPSPTHDASKLQKQDPSVCPSPTASPLRMK